MNYLKKVRFADEDAEMGIVMSYTQMDKYEEAQVVEFPLFTEKFEENAKENDIDEPREVGASI